MVVTMEDGFTVAFRTATAIGRGSKRTNSSLVSLQIRLCAMC